MLVVVSGDDFGSMLRAGLERIGGLEKLIGPSQDVLIKPNLNAVDVYPAISSAGSIATLAEEVVKVTSGRVRVGDMGFHADDRVYGHVGLEEALAGTGAEAIRFSGTYAVRRASIVKWADCKGTANPVKPDISVYASVYDAPVIVSLASLKRHFLASMSVALKNTVGAITASGARGSRSHLHELHGNNFQMEVAEIAGVINPELTVVDARSALIGNGPFSNSAGAEILEGVNLLVISGDLVAVDLYCSMILKGLDRTFSSGSIEATVKHAHALGLGVKDLGEVEILDQPTSIEGADGSSAPERFALDQNYPNPFNAATEIGFRVDQTGPVSVAVYNALGRRVSTLLDRRMVPGSYAVTFDGSGLASGTYFCQLKAGSQMVTKRMILLK